MSAVDTAAKRVLAYDDYVPKVDLDLYPRTDIHIPSDTDGGGWATKATVKCTRPASDALAGRTVALKDNIALAHVRCTNGTGAMDWTPGLDATVATRVLDAGATITGKAACENACFGAISDTSLTGPVQNPRAEGYSAGGSSSGCARLVASGAVDLAVGCDQGGSVRLPASNCGIVGLKPTWGLVPYTGIISLEATIDHAGPMTRDVRDCARLMDVLAGSDGVDDRVPLMLKPGDIKFEVGVDEVLGKDPATALQGLRVGVLAEGFTSKMQDPKVEKLVRSAASRLKDFGAQVTECSVPLHSDSALAWMCYMPLASARQGLLSNMTGRKQLIMTDRVKKAGRELSQSVFDALGAGGQNIYLRGLFLEKTYGPELHARANNLLRRLNDAYDKALQDFDVLIMPTTPKLPARLSDGKLKPLAKMSRYAGIPDNTSPFNTSGHPALSVPVGLASPADDPSVKLPVGMQIVGRKYEDLNLLRAAAVLERDFDWTKTYAE
ncbi:amidase signature domain-containing protein [Xylariomycetidae sp. FL0641]|nr:amidase signature domain-containing protein [Xylariomycetidae sp. FL0641]